MSLNIQLESGYKRVAGNSEGGSDSVIYYDKAADFPTTGELEKLYVDKATGEIFTWNSTKTEYVAAGVTKAEGITYDNTDSSLSSTDVQAAIDEVVANMKDIELFKFPNATIIGAPTINNGQVSGFSASNYMKFPFIVNMQGRPFTIDIAFTTGTDVTNQQNIIDGIDHGIAFAIRDRRFILVLGSKTGEWDISGGEKQSGQIVDPGKSYRVKISWDGSVYKFEYSDNGESYTEVTAMRVTSSLSPYPTQINIGVTSGLGGIFKGIINMNYCSLTISDKVVWTGMDDVGLATRMAVDMSNIDQAGIDKIKSIAPSYISGGDGINVNNDPSSENYKKITNTGVISVIESPDTKEESGEDKYEDGTILVQTGIESEDNPPVPVKVKGINTAAFMPIEKEITEDSDDGVIPTSKAVADFVLDNTDSNTWIGTKADYEKEKDDIETGTKVFITDDEGESVALIHSNITGRDAADSHPMSAITGLSDSLDNKVNKSETSLVDNTTRIVEVPEDVDCFGSTAMIGGKTVKSKNLFIIKDDETGVSKGVNYTISDGVVSVSGTTEGNAVVQMLKEEIYISEPSIAYITDSNIKNMVCALSYFEEDSTTRKYLSVPAAGVSLPVGIRVASMYLQKNSTGDVVSGSCKPMIVKGSEKIPYEPYFDGLRSAPVESIVSQGKNLLKIKSTGYESYNNVTIKYNPNQTFDISTNGTASANTSINVFDYSVKLKKGKTYVLSVNGVKYSTGDDGLNIAFRYKNATGTQVTIAANRPITPDVDLDIFEIPVWVPSGKSKNYENIGVQLEEASSVTEYLPYNKTELSLADITKNLPDYGMSAGDVYNYIDFERGKYYRNAASVKLNSFNYNSAGTTVTSDKSRLISTTTVFGIKDPSATSIRANVICNKYEALSDSQTYNCNVGISIKNNKIYIYDNNYDTTGSQNDFINSLTDNDILVYELETPEVFDLSDILPPIHIEPSGTLEFVNEYNLDVPSKVIYKKTV